MADILQKQLLRAFKDPNSYTKFMNRRGSGSTASVKSSILNKNNSDTGKSLKVIQDLLKAQNANQKIPQTWVKNDFRKEKINHKEIEKRITDSNSLSKELNRIAEDFRATLFNINNMREFDIRLNSLFQTDLSALLDLQRSLTENQMFEGVSGNSVKRISIIQEKMYKVMEKIQRHFIVQQDIKHKKKDQTVVINVNDGGSEGSSPIILPNDNDTGESFFGPLFQYLGIRNVAKGAATAVAARTAGKALSSEVRSSKAIVAKNASKMKTFLAKHKVLGFLAKHKLGAIIITALTYGALTLDSSEFGKLLESTGGLISSTLQPLAQTLKDSFIGGGDDLSMRGIASQSVSSYINGNGYFGTLGQIASHSTQAYLFSKGMEKGTVLAKTMGQAGKNAVYNARLSVNAKLSDIITKQIKRLESSASKGIKGWTKGVARDLFDMTDDKLVKRYLNTGELQKTTNYKGFSKQLRKNRLLQKMARKVPVFGVGVGCLFSVPDIINFFSVDMDKQVNHALEILKKDESRFKNKTKYKEMCKKIISNMESSRKWWMATILESISLSAVNVGVGIGTGGIGLAVSVLVTSILDALFDWVRDTWLGFDFDLIDFDNPYTFISQEDLVEATTVSFLLNGSNIKIDDIKEEFRQTGDARAIALQTGINALVKRINGLKFIKYDFSDTFVKKPGWSDGVTTSRVNWGLTVLCLNAFRSGTHYSNFSIKDNTMEPHWYGNYKVEEYGNDVMNVGAQSSIYYPLMEGDGGLYQPVTNGTLTASKILNDNESSSVILIKNIIYSLLFLYTISMLFRNNINIKLRDEIKNFINGKATYKGFHGNWGLAVEFLRFNYAGYPGDKWKNINDEGSEIKFLKDEVAPNVVNSLNDVNSWCQNNKSLTQIIKSYTLIYLLYRFKYRDSNNTDIRETLNKIDVETVRTMVEILRSPEDWNKIYDYYDKNKGNIAEITKGESLYIGSDLKLNNTSSFKNEVIKGVDITTHGSGYESLKFGNVGIDYDLGEYIELDDNIKNNNEYANRVKLAGAITQESLKTNTNSSLAIAEVCLAYADAYNKHLPDNRKIKLDSLDDIRRNYHEMLKKMLEDGDGKIKNKEHINRLSTIDDKSISKKDITDVVNDLTVTYYNNTTTSAKPDNINGNIIDSEYKGKLSEGVLNSDGIGYIRNKNGSVGEGSGNNPNGTNPTVGKAGNNYGNASGDFDLNSVMNSNIYDKGNGIFYSDDPFVQYVLNKESGGRANAKSPLSSATGLFQFTEATWADITKGKDFSLATDPYENFKAFKMLVRRNASILKNAGTPLTRYTMYMTHQQGAGGLVNIGRIASGKLKKGSKDYDKTMTNINKNIPPNLRRSGIWDTLSDQDKAANFLSAWEADTGGTQVNIIRSNATEADMQEDAVKNDDGISDVLFITNIMNDMLFGTQLSM